MPAREDPQKAEAQGKPGQGAGLQVPARGRRLPLRSSRDSQGTCQDAAKFWGPRSLPHSHPGLFFPFTEDSEVVRTEQGKVTTHCWAGGEEGSA